MKTDFISLNLSCKKLLVFIQLIVFAAWLIQLVFHQTWIGISPHINWSYGLSISLLLSCIPLFYCIGLRRSSLPMIKIDAKDIVFLLLLLVAALFCWWFFSAETVYYPLHTYSDEDVHTARVQLMVDDIRNWINVFIHHASPPPFRSEYMVYPALAYVPVTLWTMITGQVGSIPAERLFLVVNYLSVVLASYFFARLIIKSRLMSFLLALLPASSALLISYTMSFYIELHYVAVMIFAFALLAWGMQKQSKEIVMTAVLVSSIIPVIRESAIAAAGGIILAASIWCFFSIKNEKWFLRIFSAMACLAIGLLPFVVYYVAKSFYSDRDVSRTSLAFISQQDYASLLSYSILYLGPLAILSLLYFVLTPRQVKRDPFLILAALCGVGGGIFLQAIFTPGYMPWTRNYLFYYADFIILITLFLDCVQTQGSKKGVLFLLLIAGISANFAISLQFLPNNKYFNEVERIYDVRPIANYMNQHQSDFANQTIYVHWPRGFAAWPEKTLPDFVHLAKITAIGSVARFLDFNMVKVGLPHDAHYLLFYYFKNDSKPAIFRALPSVNRPSPSQLNGYRILVDSPDKWSDGNSGVMLIERLI